jgi:hypothetical protein
MSNADKNKENYFSDDLKLLAYIADSFLQWKKTACYDAKKCENECPLFENYEVSFSCDTNAPDYMPIDGKVGIAPCSFMEKVFLRVLKDIKSAKSGALEMRLYLSGRVTGLENCREIFSEAEERLVEAGYEVINPLKMISIDAEYSDAMRSCIRMLIEDKCKGIALIDNWKDSDGAKLERDISKAIDIPIMSVDQWVNAEKRLK